MRLICSNMERKIKINRHVNGNPFNLIQFGKGVTLKLRQALPSDLFSIIIQEIRNHDDNDIKLKFPTTPQLVESLVLLLDSEIFPRYGFPLQNIELRHKDITWHKPYLTRSRSLCYNPNGTESHQKRNC